MIRILFIITSFIFLLNNASAETFSAALKKAYKNNNELNAERESLNISEQELNDYLVKLANRDREQSEPKPFKPFANGFLHW